MSVKVEKIRLLELQIETLKKEREELKQRVIKMQNNAQTQKQSDYAIGYQIGYQDACKGVLEIIELSQST